MDLNTAHSVEKHQKMETTRDLWWMTFLREKYQDLNLQKLASWSPICFGKGWNEDQWTTKLDPFIEDCDSDQASDTINSIQAPRSIDQTAGFTCSSMRSSLQIRLHCNHTDLLCVACRALFGSIASFSSLLTRWGWKQHWGLLYWEYTKVFNKHPQTMSGILPHCFIHGQLWIMHCVKHCLHLQCKRISKICGVLH